MGMDVGGSGDGPKSEINVTPFVDVVLVLLIIFMVLTPLVLKEVKVSIPKKADDEVTADVAAQQMVLQLKKDGRIDLAGRPVTLANLSTKVRSLFANREKKVLFVQVEDAANYGLAVKVMDACLGAGVRTLGMVTK